MLKKLAGRFVGMKIKFILVPIRLSFFTNFNLKLVINDKISEGNKSAHEVQG